MDMIDYRFAVMVNEDRVRSHLRERSRQRQLDGLPRAQEPRSKSRRRWTIVDLVGLIVPKRGVKLRKDDHLPQAPLTHL